MHVLNMDAQLWAVAQVWSSEDRQKLQLVFQSTVRSEREPFREYVDKMVVRFRQHCPHRSPQEVDRKIREMMQLKQFKQPGEVEYWNAIMNKRTQGRSRTRSSTELPSQSTTHSQLSQAQRTRTDVGSRTARSASPGTRVLLS
jgi:hypothetical protein